MKVLIASLGKLSGSGSKVGSSRTSFSKTSLPSSPFPCASSDAPRYIRACEMSERSRTPLFGSSRTRSRSSASIQLRARNDARAFSSSARGSA